MTLMTRHCQCINHYSFTLQNVEMVVADAWNVSFNL